MCDFRLLPLPFGILCNLEWWFRIDVLEQPIGPIFKVQAGLFRNFGMKLPFYAA